MEKLYQTRVDEVFLGRVLFLKDEKTESHLHRSRVGDSVFLSSVYTDSVHRPSLSLVYTDTAHSSQSQKVSFVVLVPVSAMILECGGR